MQSRMPKQAWIPAKSPAEATYGKQQSTQDTRAQAVLAARDAKLAYAIV